MMKLSKIKLLIFNNLVFILYGVGAVTGLVYLQGMAAGFIVLLLPGLGWSLRFGSEDNDIILTMLLAVFISFFVFLFGFLGCILAGITVNPYIFAAALLVVSNAGIFLIKREKVPTMHRYQMVFFTVMLMILSINAIKMPLIFDIDATYMQTSYGLVHDLKPYKNFSRVPYALDHPPGPPMLSAASVFLLGEDDKVKEAYLSAKEIENKYEKDEIWEFWDKIPGTEEARQEILLSRKKDLLFATRVPQFFLSAFLLLILCELVKRRTGSVFFGVFTAIVFLGPEMYARLSYADYTTSILFILLAMYYVYAYRERSVLWPVFLGFCAAWINQKTIILPAAFILVDLYRLRGKTTIRSAGYMTGWILGFCTVALYGYFLNWQCFLRNFLFDHGVVGMLEGGNNIMGFFAAWTRGALYMNPAIFLLCLLSLGYYLIKSKENRSFVIPVWFLIGFFIFIFSKWPITRNCAVVYPAMFIALGCFLSSRGLWVKRGLTILVGAMYCFNIFIMQDSFFAPEAFYAYRETSNSPAKMVRKYGDYIQQIFKWQSAVDSDIFREKRVELIESSPEASWAYADRGNMHKQMGEAGEALRSYKKAIRLDPGNAGAYNNLGNLFAAEGKSDEAIEAYKRSIEADPDSAGGYLNLGVAYFQQGRVQSSIELYRKVIELAPNSGEAYNNLGNAYRRLKKYEEAINAYEKAIRINAQYPDVYFNLGNAYFEAGRLEEAIAPYKKVLEMNPSDRGAYNNLNIVYRKQGMLDEAIELNIKVLENAPDQAKVYYQLAVLYYRKGDFPRSVMYYDKAEKGGVANKEMREALKAYYGPVSGEE